MQNWQAKAFTQLTPLQLHCILQLRELVFQIEQQCLYRDIDDIDYNAIHVMCFENEKLIAYSRLYKNNDGIHIGRVVVAKSARGRGLGRELINQCLRYINKNHPNETIVMSAQLYLQEFYESLGFKRIGDPYDEDGILHIKMIC